MSDYFLLSIYFSVIGWVAWLLGYKIDISEEDRKLVRELLVMPLVMINLLLTVFVFLPFIIFFF